MDNHVAMLEGVEQVSYYLVWSRIEEKFLAVTFEAQDELEKNFVQLYSVLLSFMARSIRFLRKKTRKWTLLGRCRMQPMADLTSRKNVWWPPFSHPILSFVTM